MTSDLLEENQDLRKHNEKLIALINAERERQEKCDDVHLRKIADLENELKTEKEYSATLRKEIDEYTNSHTLCVKYKELEAQIKEMKGILLCTCEGCSRLSKLYKAFDKELKEND